MSLLKLYRTHVSYECAWQFLITNVDAARMMLAWFQYMDEQLLFHPASTIYKLKVPWAQIARVFLNCDGLAFNSAYLRKYANRSDDDLNGEKLGAWKEKIAEIMKKIRSESRLDNFIRSMVYQSLKAEQTLQQLTD